MNLHVLRARAKVSNNQPRRNKLHQAWVEDKTRKQKINRYEMDRNVNKPNRMNAYNQELDEKCITEKANNGKQRNMTIIESQYQSQRLFEEYTENKNSFDKFVWGVIKWDDYSFDPLGLKICNDWIQMRQKERQIIDNNNNNKNKSEDDEKKCNNLGMKQHDEDELLFPKLWNGNEKELSAEEMDKSLSKYGFHGDMIFSYTYHMEDEVVAKTGVMSEKILRKYRKIILTMHREDHPALKEFTEMKKLLHLKMIQNNDEKLKNGQEYFLPIFLDHVTAIISGYNKTIGYRLMFRLEKQAIAYGCHIHEMYWKTKRNWCM